MKTQLAYEMKRLLVKIKKNMYKHAIEWQTAMLLAQRIV